MTSRAPKTYTIAITKTIMVNVNGDSAHAVFKTVDAALLANVYATQWAQAIANIGLIGVE